MSDYRFESVRLNSFENCPSLLTKSDDLAVAGFFYTGKDNTVKCFECDIEVYNLQRVDDPMAVHKQMSEHCRFVCKIPCGNVPIGTDPDEIPAFELKEEKNTPCYGVVYMPPLSPNSENPVVEERVNYWLNLLNLVPKHPKCASYDVRLSSYDTWPKTMPQTKEELAAAGFCYSGRSDETFCYHCGGGLKNWEPKDDPWEQHARHHEQCPYLIISKGTEFVNKITGTKLVKMKNVPSISIESEEISKKINTKNITIKISQMLINSKETNLIDTN